MIPSRKWNLPPGWSCSTWIDHVWKDNDILPADIWKTANGRYHRGSTIRRSPATRWRRRQLLIPLLSVPQTSEPASAASHSAIGRESPPTRPPRGDRRRWEADVLSDGDRHPCRAVPWRPADTPASRPSQTFDGDVSPASATAEYQWRRDETRPVTEGRISTTGLEADCLLLVPGAKLAEKINFSRIHKIMHRVH